MPHLVTKLLTSVKYDPFTFDFMKENIKEL